MTVAEFRRIALSFDGAGEKRHMGHPDFRAAGRIFATRGYPDARHGTFRLSPQHQAFLVRDHPKAFEPAAGAWGRSGRVGQRGPAWAAWASVGQRGPASASGVTARGRRRR